MAELNAREWTGARVRAASNVRYQEFDGETVLVDLEGGEYYGLDGVGAFLWELLQVGATLTEMVAAVMLRFDVDEATCASDLFKLLDQLSAANLVDVAPSPA